MKLQFVNNSIESAVGLENAIKSALLNGDLGMARELAMRGHQEFPDNDHLTEAAIVLAPPKIVSRNVPPKPGLYQAMDWLETHREDYKGLWVALHNGNFVAAATSRMELIDKINEVSPISDIVITFVE